MSYETLHISAPVGVFAAWRNWRASRTERRERIRTMKILADLPRDLRADIGWPSRYYAETDKN